MSNKDVKSTATLPAGVTRSDNILTSTFYVWIAKKTGADESFQVAGKEIKDFRLLAYIDGADEHCVLDAQGGCKISIQFDATNDINKFGGIEISTEKIYEVA